MKLKIVVALLAGLVLAGGLFVWMGVFNVSAAEKHWKITTLLLELVRERSIHVRAKDIEVPVLTDKDALARGAKNYKAMCAQCHLAPGMETTELNLGLYPAPPVFHKSTHAIHDPAATFWTIKNGLKLTGMPAWGAFHTDQQIWELVAFVGKLKGMSEEVFETLSGAGEHNSQQSAHSHMPLQSHGH